MEKKKIKSHSLCGAKKKKKKRCSNKQLKIYLGFVIDCSVDAIYCLPMTFYFFCCGGIVVYCSYSPWPLGVLAWTPDYPPANRARGMCSVWGRYFCFGTCTFTVTSFFSMFVLGEGAGRGRKQLIYIIYRKMVLINVIIFSFHWNRIVCSI